MDVVGKPKRGSVIRSMLVYITLFFISHGPVAITLVAFDLDFVTSASAAVTALAKVGPGLGSIFGPPVNFTMLPDGVKWILAFAMLLARLNRLQRIIATTRLP